MKNYFYCPSEQEFYNTFPSTSLALDDCHGLLCFSDYSVLNSDLLIRAYSQGIFPWSEENESNVLGWFAPIQRPVFFVNEWKPSRSIKRVIKCYGKQGHELLVNQDFSGVLNGCADREQTWISPVLKKALYNLYEKGKVLAFEVRTPHVEGDILIGGLYGISHHPVFFAESMFSRREGASKYAFYGMMNYLKKHSYTLVDAQVPSRHVQLLGSQMMVRDKFQRYLKS